MVNFKFNIRRLYFEKIIKNDGSKNFHNFIYDEILYPDPTKLLPAFFNNHVSAIKEAILGQGQRKYPIALGNQSMLILANNTGALNIFTTPELHRDARKSC